MPDVFSKAKRSEVMSRIRSKGNRATELALIAVVRDEGITGWRRNRPVFGKPDFVFPKERVAVFVDGCFWHFCPKHSRMPATNAEFWEKKRKSNKKRDRLVNRTLAAKGWRVLRVWEHALQKKERGALVRRVRRVIG